MHTADPRTLLGYVCNQVDRMKPGENLEMHIHDLRDIPSLSHNGATWAPPDRVLGNIVGSAYTHSYRINESRRTVTFMRYEDTGQRRYTEPDHRTRLEELQLRGT